jgi:hypothetical protein
MQLAVMVVISCIWLTSPRFAATAENATTSMPAATAPTNEIRVAATFAATDSLAAMPSDARADAQACLEGLCWTPGSFEVEIQKPWKEGAGDFCVCFPTPRPVGHASNEESCNGAICVCGCNQQPNDDSAFWKEVFSQLIRLACLIERQKLGRTVTTSDLRQAGKEALCKERET